MKIEDINPKNLVSASKLEILSLHLRLHQLYSNFLKTNPSQQNEQLVNSHIFVIEEMKKRKITHNVTSVIDRESEKIKKLAEFAPVISDIQFPDKDKISWDSIKEYLKPFIISKNAISIVGGVACNGSGNDIDILVKIPPENKLFDIIAFRLYRMFPIELRKKLHIFQADNAGPFTSHFNIADLQITMNDTAPLVKMQESIKSEATSVKPEETKQVRIEDSGYPAPPSIVSSEPTEKEINKKQAEESERTNNIVPGRFFLPMKPTKASMPGKRQTMESFLKMFKPEDFPVYSSIKRDGVRGVIHKLKDKVWIFTEEGSDVTDKLPSLIKAVRNLPFESIVFDCEFELWPVQGNERVHSPREEMSARLLLEESNDIDVFVQCFAILYLNGTDYHTEPYEYLYSLMVSLANSIPISIDSVPKSKIQFIQHIIDKDVDELENTTKNLMQVKYSEGNVAKMAKSVYNLAGKRSGWVKFRSNSTAIAQVLDIIPTVNPEVANLELALLSDDVLISMGRSFNVKTEDYKKGQLVTVEYETLNHVIDEGVESFSFWAPRIIEPKIEAGKPNNIKDIIRTAKRDLVYQKKIISNGIKSFFIE